MKTLIRLLPLLVAASALAQSTADTIIARELQSSRSYETLSHLTDDIGARLTGSKGAALAVRGATQPDRERGISVFDEPVEVAAWLRRRQASRRTSSRSIHSTR